jgi:excinuclease UvrABC ATPase subunit
MIFAGTQGIAKEKMISAVGGKIVTEGPPEKIIQVPASHTGHYLKSVVG